MGSWNEITDGIVIGSFNWTTNVKGDNSTIQLVQKQRNQCSFRSNLGNTINQVEIWQSTSESEVTMWITMVLHP